MVHQYGIVAPADFRRDWLQHIKDGGTDWVAVYAPFFEETKHITVVTEGEISAEGINAFKSDGYRITKHL